MMAITYTDDDDDNQSDDDDNQSDDFDSDDAYANKKDGADDDKVEYNVGWLLGWVKKPNICICS